MDVSELFWNASLDELKKGYVKDHEQYICLLCGKKFEEGIIYSDEGVFYEAQRYMRVHIERVHKSVFEYLIQLDKKLTGLTNHQRSLLELFYQGKNDIQVQKEMKIGSSSTIRNHRFVLKEKERQAKVLLAIMELFKERDEYAPTFLDIHKTAKMVDERYNITHEENEAVIKKYFPEGPDGSLKTFDIKEKERLIVLRYIVKRIDREQIYSEKQINEILEKVYDDYVILRRYLIEYGFLDRKPDGSEYWRK
ncbi:MAG: DUF2087 domain-containing protein [Deltaproteobacteria bacterium]